MANIKVTGSALAIVSEVNLDDLKNIVKYRPNALKLMSEDGKECIYAITVGAGKGSINKFGATFSDITHNTEGKATITMDIPDDVNDATEYIMDRVGVAIVHINAIEARVEGVKAEIAAERQLIRESIVID